MKYLIRRTNIGYRNDYVFLVTKDNLFASCSKQSLDRYNNINPRKRQYLKLNLIIARKLLRLQRKRKNSCTYTIEEYYE